MSDLTLILLAAGSSSRFEQQVKKQWLRTGSEPLWSFVANNMAQKASFAKIIITAAADELPFMSVYADYTFVAGGNTRQESLYNALASVETPYVLVSDIARACISDALLQRLLEKKESADVTVPYLPVTDTIVYHEQTIQREAVKRIQTPQLSKTAILKKAVATEELFSDESSAIVAIGGSRAFILGDENAHKITYPQDLKKIPCLKEPSTITLSGNGFDVHAFDNAKDEMWLGGVKIASAFGFKAHSDGDVALHALIDALLGAAGMGDIGMLFPDTDSEYEGIDSKILLERVVTKLLQFGYEIVNVDITIAAQTPRLGNYKDAMRTTIAAILHLQKQHVNIKATTTEKLGFIGRKEGVGVMATANLKYFDWKSIE